MDTSRVYRALLENVLPYLAGETEAPPIPMTELIEPEMAAVAMMKSKNLGGIPVEISELSESDYAYDGTSFGVEYRRLSGY